jgi:hypothetical protein
MIKKPEAQNDHSKQIRLLEPKRATAFKYFNPRPILPLSIDYMNIRSFPVRKTIKTCHAGSLGSVLLIPCDKESEFLVGDMPLRTSSWTEHG